MNKNKLEKRHRQTSIDLFCLGFLSIFKYEIKIKKKKKNERNAVLPPVC